MHSSLPPTLSINSVAAATRAEPPWALTPRMPSSVYLTSRRYFDIRSPFWPAAVVRTVAQTVATRLGEILSNLPVASLGKRCARRALIISRRAVLWARQSPLSVWRSVRPKRSAETARPLAPGTRQVACTTRSAPLTPSPIGLRERSDEEYQRLPEQIGELDNRSPKGSCDEVEGNDLVSRDAIKVAIWAESHASGVAEEDGPISFEDPDKSAARAVVLADARNGVLRAKGPLAGHRNVAIGRDGEI